MSAEDPVITLLVFTDGRPHIWKTLPVFENRITGPIQHRFIINDEQDPAYDSKLHGVFGNGPYKYKVITWPQRMGFCGSIGRAWKILPEDTDYVMHFEDDFYINRNIDLRDFIEVLQAHPKLAQMAMLRQPWNEEEKACGGVIQKHPDWYIDHEYAGHKFCVGRVCFTTNPCLYPFWVTKRGYLPPPECEGHFGLALVRDGYEFGYWGLKSDPPLVEHIGYGRRGTGY